MPTKFLFPIVGDDWRISSGFGSRNAPIAGASTNHHGIDIAAPLGTNIIAPVDIRITQAGLYGPNGNLIRGVDTNNNEYAFAHLSQIGVKPGDIISAGQVIGKVGETGVATGPHLHFQVKDSDGKLINPTSLLDNALHEGKGLVDKGLEILGYTPQGMIAKTLDKYSPFNLGGVGDTFTGLTGIGGDSWFEQLKKWIDETQFFKRSAIIILAVILIGAAFFMLNSGTVKKIATAATKVPL